MGISRKLKVKTFFSFFNSYGKTASVIIFVFCISLFLFTNCQMIAEDPLNIASQDSVVPNLLSHVQILASQNTVAFSSSCMSWDFIDLVIEELRDHNERFGYNCEQGNCTAYSTNRVAFYTGSGSTSDSADGSGEVVVVEVVDCTSNPSLTWLEKINVNGLWKLNRGGAGNSVASYPINPLPGSTTLTASSSTTSTTISEGGTSKSSCQVPNKSNVVNQIASSYAQALQDSDCGNEYQNTTWEFLDKVVENLHSSDERWGYNCKHGDCTQLSKDAIAYYCGGGTPNSNSVSVGIIDIITGTNNNCLQQWVDVTEETRNSNTVGRWLYPLLVLLSQVQVIIIQVQTILMQVLLTGVTMLQI